MSYESKYASWIGLPQSAAQMARSERARRRTINAAPITGTTWLNQLIGATTSLGTLASAIDAYGTWTNHSDVSSLLGIGRYTTNAVQLRHYPVATVVMMTHSSFSNVRYWAGIGENGIITSPASSDDMSGVYNFIGFRASSFASDTTWKFCGFNSAGTLDVIYDTGVTIAVSTRYDFTITVTGDGNAYGSIGVGGKLPGSHTAIPIGSGISDSTAYALLACADNAGTTKAIRISKLEIESE